MATYCYRCPDCGTQYQVTGWAERLLCSECPAQPDLVRDYKSENVGIAVAELKRQREQGLDGLSGKKAQRDVFLPTAEDFRKPGDPDGQKGIRDWAERHGPRPTNKKPLYPDMDKKVW